MSSSLHKRLWKQVAIGALVVGVVLGAGKVLPLPGIPGEVFAEINLICRSGSPLFQFPSLIVCPGPLLAHEEVLVTPLMGGFAIIAFFAIWLRRRLANR